MATIALQIAGTAVGSFLGGPVGAAIGSALGGTFGSMVDRAILGGGGKRVIEGPRLSDLHGISASEGAPVPRVYGRVRIGGQIIWATEFEEQRIVEKTGGGKSTAPKGPKTVRYAYSANVAIGLCEGPVAFVRRIWADGEELDLTSVTMRVHTGRRDQQPDPLIVAKQESGAVPAFRGLAYVVFERLPLEKYGNRLPQFAFEVVRALPGLPEQIRAINIIPGSTEFGYATSEVRESFGLGASQPVNRAQWTHKTDWDASIDALQALAPNLERVTLISAWFGDDLRAQQCSFRPKTEKAGKATTGGEWSVGGLSRATALPVSATEGRPNFGGSPSDTSVIAAIRDLKARGLKVALNPFVLMDIPSGNSRADPYSGASAQPAFPWRGRITSDPAPGRVGSPEGTPALAGQIAALVGTAMPVHFTQSGDSVIYSGPDEWSYRRMILHHAMLAKVAGGVETFFLGSEMVGLTHASSGGGTFPFVTALGALASDVRSILGPATRITYAADWTEYGARVRNGGQDVRFPLDQLWAHAEIGAIAIDFYPPVSDWRAGGDHLDAAIADGPADIDYLRDRTGSGEAFDWYYADVNGRAAQARLPISDGTFGKPWVYRAKDIKGWWENPHVERAGGVELAATAFVPKSKPILLAEIGCPAVDKGANQPNLFPDPKSIENALPYFSNGGRDDLVQRRLLEGVIGRFDHAAPGFAEAWNPVSPLYGGRMVDRSFIAPWAWDARPFPVFPRQRSLWSDGENWQRGHWLNGRLEGCPVDTLMSAILTDFGHAAPSCRGIEGMIDGYVVDRPMSARAALEPLAAMFGLVARAEPGGLTFVGAGERLAATLDEADLVPAADGTLVEIVRRQETELPREFSFRFIEPDADFRAGLVRAETAGSRSNREIHESAPMHMTRGLARRLVEMRLQDIWSAREMFKFRLGLRALALEPGDLVRIPVSGGTRIVQLTRVSDDLFRECEGRAFTLGLATDIPVIDELPPEPGMPALPGSAHVRLIELPVDRGGELLQAVVRAEPWRGPYSVSRTDGGALQELGSVTASAIMGVTLTSFPPGPLWRWDHAAMLDIAIEGGPLSSLAPDSVLAGGNALALRGADGTIEIVLFRDAQLIGIRRYRLSGLLRGMAGSEAEAARTLPPGAEAILLDDAILDLAVGIEALGAQRNYLVLPAGRDIGDPTGVTLSQTVSGQALKPLSPVHPRARREAGGIRVTFIRRARRDGDSWDVYEVPLVEEREEYRVEIRNGASVVRTATVTSPEYFYSTANESADFGVAQNNLSVRIAQISALCGEGHALEAIVPVR